MTPPPRSEASPRSEIVPPSHLLRFEPVSRWEIARRFIAIGMWLGLFRYLVPLGNLVVPDATKVKFSLQTFLITCQATTLAVGLGVSLALLRRRRAGLGFERIPRILPGLSTILSVPLVFVVSSYVALQIALPTLLEELKTRAHASQVNAGEFGRALTTAPLLTTLLWGAVIGAIGEELLFRGLLWSTITDLTKRLLPPGHEDAPPGTLAQRASRIALSGGVATVLSAALFGLMHADLPGGVGIVRIVSTTCLGLASGIVRHVTGGVIACFALHALYNTLVIGNGRRWFASQERAILEGVPNTLVMFAVVGLAGVAVIAFVRALMDRRARSTFVAE